MMAKGAFRGFLRTAAALCCVLLALGCAPSPSAGPALWRVTDADSTVILFGTVHVLPENLSWKSPRVEAAFASADTVWFETATDAQAAERITAIVADEGANPPGLTLSEQLEPEDRARLSRVSQRAGVSLAALESVRPWVAALRLSLAVLVKQGHSPDVGVERVLEADAVRQGKQIAYFETAEDQMAVFTGLSPRAQAQFLSATLRQIEQESGAGNDMDKLWASGRADELGRLVTRMIEEAGPEVAEALIYRRNAAWAERIDEVMAGKGVAFVAVGAAHMTGPRGLPALLEAKGHTVRREGVVR
jgi:hypothetical protein